MFTGIIEELGDIVSVSRGASGAEITVAAKKVTEGSFEGDSIAVNGVCLTALGISGRGFRADVSNETLDKSTLSRLKIGTKVNLERAVTPASRLGGHIVQGHVDGRGTFVSAMQDGDFWTVRVKFPGALGRYMVKKGSISVEGISLTIADIGDETFDIAVIPKTWESTNLSTLRGGDEVNLEVDVIAKYVERILTYGNEERREALTMEKLAALGYIK